MDYIVLLKSRISFQGVHTPVETFFRDIASGAVTVAGGKAPKNVHENQAVKKA
jgi:hypothetical protein